MGKKLVGQAGTKKTRDGKKRAFCAAYASMGTITGASEACGLAPGQHYVWLASPRDGDEYRAMFEQAEAQAADRLEKEALRRAVEGVDRPVYQCGALVGYVREYSDTLLIFLLKGLRPQKYRDNYHLTGEIGVRPIVREDASWFQTDNATERGGSAATIEASATVSGIAGPVQGDGVRSPVGQNGNGHHHGHEGPRS